MKKKYNGFFLIQALISCFFLAAASSLFLTIQFYYLEEENYTLKMMAYYLAKKELLIAEHDFLNHLDIKNKEYEVIINNYTFKIKKSISYSPEKITINIYYFIKNKPFTTTISKYINKKDKSIFNY